MKAMLLPVVAVVVLGVWCGAGSAVEHGKEGKEGHEKLLQMLPNSSVSLSEGVRKLMGNSTETPFVAKFKVSDKGELLLCVFVAEKGFETPIEKNVLKAISTNVEAGKWKPETASLTDSKHLAWATERFKLMSSSHESLLDALARAENDHKGATIAAIYAMAKDGKPEFLVRYVEGHKLAEAWYDFGEGKKVTGKNKEWVPYGSTYGAPYK